MKILLIEDDVVISSNLRMLLEDKGFIVSTSSFGKEGLKRALINEYDAIILDWMLPDIGGDQICRSIRDEDISTPIIFLTAKNQIEDKVTGLDIGADDYLTKPFEVEELLARVRSVIRRRYNSKLRSEISIDNLTINISKCEVRVNDELITLSPKLYSLFEFLAINLDQVVTRANLIEHLWDSEADLFSNVIDVHIKNLRRELSRFALDKLVKTVKGQGYMLCSKK